MLSAACASIYNAVPIEGVQRLMEYVGSVRRGGVDSRLLGRCYWKGRPSLP